MLMPSHHRRNCSGAAVRRRSRAFTLAVLIVALGCAQTLPPEPAASALYRDLQRLVTLRSAIGWQIDRFEIEALMPEVLMSVCQTEPRAREALIFWLDARIKTLGGPVADAYRSRGKKLGNVSELVELTRIRDTLKAAGQYTPADCPFWLEATPGFAGRQISDDRWQLSFGGGGKAILVDQQGQSDVNFGGAGRLLVGRTMGPQWGFYTGADFGGNAGFPKDSGGDRSKLVLTVDAVVPLVMRYRLVNTYLEAEVGYFAHATEEDWGDVGHGAHVGMAVGARSSKVRWFFPGAAFGISYDRTFEDGGDYHALKVGFRVAVDVDL